ncbi:hypothetical protein [Mythimna sequax nucleopolyhedrovirus]|nr:hypothetical protein [Mythimna sequax nucleopolyhedrovirus]
MLQDFFTKFIFNKIIFRLNLKIFEFRTTMLLRRSRQTEMRGSQHRLFNKVE